jgi:sulfur-oxidizing protein SoxZ
MAEIKTLIKLKPKTYSVGEVVVVDFMAMHPMESGMRKDKDTGVLIPAHYINEVTFFNDKVITKMVTWESLSVNPPFFGQSQNYGVRTMSSCSIQGIRGKEQALR